MRLAFDIYPGCFLPKSRLEMIRGEKSREKWILFKEADPSVLNQQLDKILAG